MVAAINSMAFVGATPWHGLGRSVTDPAIMVNASEFMKSAGMDWDVTLKSLQTPDGLAVPNRAVVRSVAGVDKVLGVVGPAWEPLQNIDAFQFFQPWLNAGLAKLETAGSLFDGEKVWVLARLDIASAEVVRGDEISPYVLLSNSHDGKHAVRAGFCPIRVVCQNTLAAAHASSVSKLVRVRHTSKLQVNLETLRDTMNLIKRDFEANLEQYRYLASKQFNQADIAKYVKQLLEVDDEKEISTRTENKIRDIFQRIVNGKGQKNPAVAGTWWAAYNGVNEAINYVGCHSQENRLDNLWFGRGVAKNADALKLAMSMAA